MQKLGEIGTSGTIEEDDLDRVYVDTNIFIGAFEGDDATSLEIRHILSQFEAHQNALVTSEITITEIGARDRFRRRFASVLIVLGTFIDLVPVAQDILLATCDYRIRMKESGRNVRLPDTIHCVTAVCRDCRFVFSADKRLFLPSHIERIAGDAAGFAKLHDLLHA